MDKTFDEAIAGVRTAERGVEVREDIAQGMEYVKQYAEEVTGQQQAALQAAQTAATSAQAASADADRSESSAASAKTAATSAAQNAQAASADAGKAKKSAASAEDSANKAAAIVSTDKTLSVEGAPADAKAVGNALKGVISADAVKTLIADALAEDHAKIKFWISEDSTSPAALFGGTWQEIASERVLMGASSTHASGTTVNAGLPNITGSVVPKLTNIYNLFISESGATITGAFYSTGVYNSYGCADATGANNSLPQDLRFDASRSNSIYGRSSTVQPAAYYVHIWHRVA